MESHAEAPCNQGKVQMVFGKWVRTFRCPVCKRTANFVCAKATCNGKRIKKAKFN